MSQTQQSTLVRNVLAAVSLSTASANQFPPLLPHLTGQQMADARDAHAGAAYLDASRPVEERIDDLLRRMTLDEKISYLAGAGFSPSEGVIGETQPLARLGIPKFRMTDATLGSKLTKGATLFPSYITLAASFNRELSYRYGRAVGEQSRADGYRILLGPGVNLYRVPHCGRNFEYLGEDPYLTARLAVSYIKGVQDAGVIATVKHMAANNSDYFRRSSNSVIDERTLREIYLPPYRAAVREGGVRAVMTSYNLVNGEWAAENRRLVTDLLRTEWGFNGLVMTDWWSVYDTEKLLASGVDLEMPFADILAADKVRAQLEDGPFTEAILDERVKCILRPCVEFGLLDGPQADASLRARWGEHRQVARQVAREGLVLLRNRDALLPLQRDTIRSIALYGRNAAQTTASGGGAAAFDPGPDFIPYEAAIRHAAGEGIEVTVHDEATARSAMTSDVAVVFLTMAEHEQMDRNFELDEDSLYLLQRVSSYNPRTIAVVSLGGGVEMASWIDRVAALIYAWYPGTYGAEALGEMLFGDINPSGKLPLSIEKRQEDTHYFGNYLPEGTILPRTFQGWDSVCENFDIEYREGLLTGYRWYDAKEIEPLFPFGFGLSYTTFTYSGLNVTVDGLEAGRAARVRFSVRNSGQTAGTEIAQLYIHDPDAEVMRPLKELKGFARVALAPGEERQVDLTVAAQDLAYWDETGRAWKVEPGRFEILIGASSRDIRLRESFRYGTDE
jgi:beta-glucosidase